MWSELEHQLTKLAAELKVAGAPKSIIDNVKDVEKSIEWLKKKRAPRP